MASENGVTPTWMASTKKMTPSARSADIKRPWLANTVLLLPGWRAQRRLPPRLGQSAPDCSQVSRHYRTGSTDTPPPPELHQVSKNGRVKNSVPVLIESATLIIKTRSVPEPPRLFSHKIQFFKGMSSLKIKTLMNGNI